LLAYFTSTTNLTPTKNQNGVQVSLVATMMRSATMMGLAMATSVYDFDDDDEDGDGGDGDKEDDDESDNDDRIRQGR